MKKNVLIDIGHPAHVHLFKHLIKLLQEDGYKVIVTAKNLKSITKLLRHYSIEFINIGNKKKLIISKGLNQLRYSYLILRIILKEKVDLGIGSSITLAQLSGITKLRSIILDDDDKQVEPLFAKYALPFATNVLTPTPLKNERKSVKDISYDGYHELAYLHPSVFSPNLSVLDDLELTPNERFFILRFVAFWGHHDVNNIGLTLKQKLDLVDRLKPYGKIFITSEKKIESELQEYLITIEPQKMHSVLYYATMFIGDSQTMTSEAAILGTPAIKCNTYAGKLSIPNELEKKYGLCFAYQPFEFDILLKKIDELLGMKDLKITWHKRRQVMLNDKINVTPFLTWFVENYPHSARLMKRDPDYQVKFK